MPTYGYTCKQCHHGFEAFQKITEDALKKCPKCGNESLERDFGGGEISLHFKGSGFYVNDYKKGGSCCPCGKPSGDCK